MRFKSALTLISEEELEKRKKIIPSEFLLVPDLKSLKVGEVHKIFEEAIFSEIKELFKKYLYEYNYRSAITASANETGDVLSEEISLKGFALRKKELAKKKITQLLDFFIKEKNRPLNEVREELLEALRGLTFSGFCDKENIFHDEVLVFFIEQSSKRLDEDVEDICISVVRSLRGSLVNKAGRSIEKEIQKLLKEKNWGAIEGLRKYGELTVDLKKQNSRGETVTPNIVLSRINSAPYDLVVKFPYSKEFLFGIHVKLLATSASVTSMGNKIIKFGKTEWAASRKFVEDSINKYNLDKKTSTPLFTEPISIREKNKENKGAEVHVLEFVDILLDSVGGSTNNREIIDGIATLCRIQKGRSMWVIVYPKNAEVSWSPKIEKITKEKGKIVFIGENGTPVFVVNQNGKTNAVINKEFKSVGIK